MKDIETDFYYILEKLECLDHALTNIKENEDIKALWGFQDLYSAVIKDLKELLGNP